VDAIAWHLSNDVAICKIQQGLFRFKARNPFALSFKFGNKSSTFELPSYELSYAL